MKSGLFRLLALIVVLSLALSACGGVEPVGSETEEPASTGAPAAAEDEPVQVKGTYTITNDFVFTYYVENAVALLDMHGFVIRDEEWELPVDSQVLGYMTYDAEKLGGEFDLNLPALPEGEFNDVDNDGQEEQGVQIFAVGYSPNLYGGPFSAGDDRSRGWPSYLASVKTDTENNDEVIGGKLIIWSPDAGQEFPTGFGSDGLLFTSDDPVGPIAAGYTIVDLDTDPFTFTKTPTAEMTLYEPADVAVKDYSELSYTEAFDKMFEVVRKEYAFNGIEGKQPDWDALYDELKPRVEQAEKDRDPNAYYLALRDFTWAFKDGHVGMDGGDYANQDFAQATEGGYGFAIRELDDGRVVVIYVLEGGPAAQAGMQVGAEVTKFNGEPVADAIGKARTYVIQSSDFAIRYQQARYLLRTTPGDTAEVTFINPGGSEQTATLTAVAERESFGRTSIYFGVDLDSLLPVDSEIITQGNSQVGYIRINSNFDDLNLLIRLFERALQQFEARGVAGIIIDMRYNSGGANLGLAGFLTDQEIPLGQLEYYSEETGQFEPEGLPEKVLPNENQYRFDKMVLLVGQACYSACEIEAYGFSQVPGMITVGQYPTGGVEAEVARGQFILPEGFSLQVPTGRFTLPDGSIFLEGQGVQPTLRVPIDEETVYSTEDVVLQAGIKAVLEPLGAGISPSASPRIASKSEAESALSAGAGFIEEKAREQYSAEEVSAPGVFTYTVPLAKSETLIWAYYWCTTTTEILEQNFKQIDVTFTLNGEEIPLDQFAVTDLPSGGNQCRIIYTALSDWKPGEHHLTTAVTFKTPINDGMGDYPAGDYISEFSVFVAP
ncbi:MAG: peptidase S41 [Chloroflexi bacterium]|nr:peptidase S41 [Chloroflexota bacterium]MDL1940786.1 PDZ domain-containing protein [Chloroflexi bacterium CFX2]